MLGGSLSMFVDVLFVEADLDLALALAVLGVIFVVVHSV